VGCHAQKMLPTAEPPSATSLPYHRISKGPGQGGEMIVYGSFGTTPKKCF